jgi:hypothetical protein
MSISTPGAAVETHILNQFIALESKGQKGQKGKISAFLGLFTLLYLHLTTRREPQF